MSGDNLTIALFAWGIAVTFGLEGRKDEGWRRWLFWGAAALFMAAGPAWPHLAAIWPQGEDFGRRVATDPTAWFILFMAGMVLIALSGTRRDASDAAPLQRQLTKSQAKTLAAELRLPPGEKRSVTIFSENVCEECKAYAEQLREVIGAVPGWNVGGGINMFDGDAKDRGLHLIARDRNNFSATEQMVLNAFIVANIDYDISQAHDPDARIDESAIFLVSRCGP